MSIGDVRNICFAVHYLTDGLMAIPLLMEKKRIIFLHFQSKIEQGIARYNSLLHSQEGKWCWNSSLLNDKGTNLCLHRASEFTLEVISVIKTRQILLELSQ